MRIALSIEHFEPRRGGGETYASNFARMLLNEGHEVHVFTFSWDEAEKGFIFHRLPRPPLKLFRRYAFAMRAQELIQREKFDIVHGFGKSVYMDVFRPGGGVHRAWLEQELKTVNGGLPRALTALRQKVSLDHRLVLKLERREYDPGARHEIIAISKMVRDEIIRHYGVPAERISVVYCGADLERFTPANAARYRAEVRRELGVPEGEVLILFLAHNYKRKGLAALVRALPLLKRSGVPFRVVVVGRGRRGPVDAAARALGVTDRVQYAGTTGAPERLYAAADIYCLPSYYDPFANSVIEAMAAGLPIVTSIYTGAGEIVTQGEQGYVVDPDNAEAFAAALGKLFDPAHRRAAAAAARRRAEEYPLQRNYDETMAVYHKALAKRGPV